MGGNNAPDNIVELTPEEHYTAHLLLIKIYPFCSKLIYAANMMCLNLQGQRSSNKRYGWLKKKFSNLQRERMKTFRHSDDTKQFLSKLSKGRDLGKTKSAMTRDLMSKNSIGKNSKYISTPVGKFDSRKSAAEFYKISPKTISSWVNKYPDKFFYI
jgi:hypothetical protein